ALSVLAMGLVSLQSDRGAAEGSADLQGELQVQAHLGIFQIGAAQQLLDPIESIDERVAMDAEITCRAHMVSACAQKDVERADEPSYDRYGIGRKRFLETQP